MATINIKFPSATLVLKKDEIRKALRAAGRLVADRAKSLIQGSSGGPGNPPKSRTGSLASKMRVTMRGDRVTITDNEYYALALEAGVANDPRPRKSKKAGGQISQTIRRMMPRPYLSTALNASTDEITRRLQDAIQKNITFKETT